MIIHLTTKGWYPYSLNTLLYAVTDLEASPKTFDPDSNSIFYFGIKTQLHHLANIDIQIIALFFP